MIEAVLFFFFSGIILVAVIGMLITRNVIHAAYALAAVLLGVAGLFVLLQADYLAVVQLFMYAGGVVVLLIFGIMLINRSQKEGPVTKHRNVFIASVLALLLVSAMLSVTPIYTDGQEGIVHTDQTKEIGFLLMTDHLLAFEFIAFLLLVVLVGAAFLAKKSETND